MGLNLLSRTKKAIYLHIPKTGGMSMTEFCIRNNIKVAPLNREIQWCLEQNNKLNKKIYGLWDDEIANPKYYSYAFVRNPYDRMVSCYKTPWVQRPEGIDFTGFLRYILAEKSDYFSNSHAFGYFHKDYNLFDDNGNQKVDFLGRFENLTNDFDFICKKLNVKNTLKHINKSDRKNYKEYYNKESIALIQKHFEKDLEFFNYNF